jgi:hypothetical protein
MYLILIKYFYYFYYLKKNKKFKFFILLDLIFFLMKKYFKLLFLKKKLVKYKNILRRSIIQIENKFNLNKITKEPVVMLKLIKQIYLLNKLDLFLKNRILGYNDFIINFLPTQLLPLGNRKKFYNLINKKLKRFFIKIKKKLNKKFFFYFMVQLFRKIKFLFVQSDPFLNKKNFLFDFFSNLSFESKYGTLLQYYRQHNKKDSLLKNRFVSFFNLISFFIYRIDFFLFKLLSFFSLSDIRNIIFKTGIYVNNKLIKTMHCFLRKYDLVKLPSFFIINYKKLYIFCLKLYFDFINKYSFKHLNNIKLKYYIELFKYATKKYSNTFYLSQKNVVLNSLKKIKHSYLDLMEEIFYFFFKLKNKKFNTIYNFDSLNEYKGNYKIEFEFPFSLKQKKKDLFFNANVNNLGNISYTLRYTSQLNKNNLFNLSYLSNFINLYFFLSKYKLFYYYTNTNKVIVSPTVLNLLIKEQKRLFYYFSILYHINFLKLM